MGCFLKFNFFRTFSNFLNFLNFFFFLFLFVLFSLFLFFFCFFFFSLFIFPLSFFFLFFFLEGGWKHARRIYPKSRGHDVVLEDEHVVEGLLGFLLALDRLSNVNTPVFVVEISCSSSSYSLSIKSVTNLFRSWEILIHEWELSLFTDSIMISTSYLPCK